MSSHENLYRLDGKNIKTYQHNPANPKAIREPYIQSNFFEDSLSNLWFCTPNYLYKYVRSKDQFESFQISNENQESFKIDLDKTGGYRLICLDRHGLLWVQIDEEEKGNLFTFNVYTKKWKEKNIALSGIEYNTRLNEVGALKEIFATRWSFGKGLIYLNFINNERDTLFEQLMTMQAHNFNEHNYFSIPKGFIHIKPNGTRQIHYFPNGKNIRSFILNDSKIEIIAGKKRFEYDPRTSKLVEIPGIISYKKEFNLTGGYKIRVDERGSFIKLSENPFTLNFIGKPAYKMFHGNTNDTTLYNTSLDGSLYSNYDSITNLGGKPMFVEAKGELFIVSNNRIIQKEEQLNTILENKFDEPKGCYYDGTIHVFDKNSYYKYNLESKTLDTICNGFYRSIFLWKNLIYTQSTSNLQIFDLEYNKIDTIINSRIINQIDKTDSGELLLGTDLGLSKMNLETKELNSFLLPNKNVTSFIKDASGNFWITTNTELFHFKPTKDVLLRYSENNYLPKGIKFTRSNIVENNHGFIHIGTENGIIKFHPDSIIEKHYNVPIYINSFKIHDLEWGNDTINMEEVNKTITLKHHENNLKFELSTIDYDPRNIPQYRTYLEGYDTDTIEWGEQSTMSYPNVKPGDYIFHYSAANTLGVKRPSFEKLNIMIDPPFYQTWWFRTIALFIIVGILFSFIQNYIHTKLRKQQFAFEKQELILKNELQLQEERNRIADELHDELGGKLSTIKFASKRVERAKTMEEIKSISQRVSVISTELIDSMRSIIWAMDSQNDNLHSLLATFRQYATTLAEDNDFKLKIDFLEIESNLPIKGQIRHHLFLVIKELLNNILKHSKGDAMEFTASIVDKKLIIELKENGLGYDDDPAVSNGKGMKTIRKRMKIINGDIFFDHNGTVKTTLQIPIS